MQLLVSSKCFVYIQVFPVAGVHAHHSSGEPYFVSQKGFEFPIGSAGIIGGLFLQLQSPRIHYKAGAPLIRVEL